MKLLIKKAKVLDLENKDFILADVLLEKGRISKIAKRITNKDIQVIDAQGLYLLPGFIDIHSHIREPGREDKESILSACLSASKGGFTTIVCMPNTQIPLDNPETVRGFLRKSQEINLINVLVCAALTRKREGKNLCEYALMAREGVRCFSDDGNWLRDSSLMFLALNTIKSLGGVVISHCEDNTLSWGPGRDDANSFWSGLLPFFEVSESVAVSRDVELALYLGAPLHISHVSTGRSVNILEGAKKKSAYITFDTCPHYLLLDTNSLKEFDSLYKVNPPLPTVSSRQVILEALKNGVLDCISTDHAPHTLEEKERSFLEAPSGMIGFETLFGVCLKHLVEENIIDIFSLIEKITRNPAKILGLKNKGLIKPGFDADLVLADLDEEFVLKEKDIVSRSKNTPFLGWKMKGKIKYTFCAGRVVYQEGG